MSIYFTLLSANEALPKVIEKFKKVLENKKLVTEIEQQLQSSLSETSNLDKYIQMKQKLNSTVSKFYQSIEELEETGVVLKGIDEGLLDFPSKRFDQTK